MFWLFCFLVDNDVVWIESVCMFCGEMLYNIFKFECFGDFFVVIVIK